MYACAVVVQGLRATKHPHVNKQSVIAPLLHLHTHCPFPSFNTPKPLNQSINQSTVVGGALLDEVMAIAKDPRVAVRVLGCQMPVVAVYFMQSKSVYRCPRLMDARTRGWMDGWKDGRSLRMPRCARRPTLYGRSLLHTQTPPITHAQRTLQSSSPRRSRRSCGSSPARGPSSGRPSPTGLSPFRTPTDGQTHVHACMHACSHTSAPHHHHHDHTLNSAGSSTTTASRTGSGAPRCSTSPPCTTAGPTPPSCWVCTHTHCVLIVWGAFFHTHPPIHHTLSHTQC